MGDHSEADERKLRALALRAAELNLAAEDALIERDRFMMELDARNYGPTRLAEVMRMHWSRVYQIRNAWPGREGKWKAKRPKLADRVAALKSDSQ